MTKWINETEFTGAVAAIKRLVDIPSVIDEATMGAGQPFGKPIIDALDEALRIATELGFTTYRDPKGYYGYAEIGEGEQIFGIVGHLDVVPGGDVSQWQYGPFNMQVVDDIMFGRGTQDDKGPTIAAMYAVKALVDAGLDFAGRIRVIFGTDEENLWRCMAEYNAHESGIDMGFVPDASFPLTYAEKGLLDFDIVGPGSSVINFVAGGAYNAVPDSAEITLPSDKLAQVAEQLTKLGYEHTILDSTITVKGKSAHAKEALEGVNAITHLGQALASVYPELSVLKFLAANDLAMEDQTTILGDIEDAESGIMSLNLGKITITPAETRIAMNVRIPVTVAKETIVDQLKAYVADYGLTFSEVDYLDPLYVEQDSPMVQTMLAVYQEISGDTEAKAMTSGGATFARTIKNSVAFGAMFPDTPDYLHQPNERWAIKDMTKAMEIYAEVINRLFVSDNK
ncbi:putative peptidase [Weissella oryzae SG25]|uniref:Putative peptidase n=1 Tax=Weissella oryzae (strain DSM 25784 / JCM 18191 / LMG 30913 / SG25) TaxID=1329250 RepID=A0A069CRS0_WEIOS|nr:Sapep family Mn(2+)-dependent dipeptidase [Weissella oryzae]GAK30480.1 putative peptidase [Weissella oryzae SG25]